VAARRQPSSAGLFALLSGEAPLSLSADSKLKAEEMWKECDVDDYADIETKVQYVK
jgi:hypothetical protein